MGDVVDVGHIRYTRWDTRKLMAKCFGRIRFACPSSLELSSDNLC